MADECIVRSHDRGLWSLYFWYDIPPAQRIQVGGQNVVAFPSGNVESILTSGPSPVFSAAELAALDAGEAILYPHVVRPDPGLTNPEKEAVARAIRTQKAQQALQEYKDKYEFVGHRFDG